MCWSRPDPTRQPCARAGSPGTWWPTSSCANDARTPHRHSSAGHTRHVQHDLAASPWPQLLQTVRTRSPLLIGPLDDLINTTEFFVHTEDVRRAQPGWEPLPEDARREGVLWRVLRSRGRAFFRRASVGVELELPDGRRHTANNGDPVVTLTGPASELLLYAYGRTPTPCERSEAQRSTSDGWQDHGHGERVQQVERPDWWRRRR